MKLAVSNIAWPATADEDAVKILRRSGVEGDRNRADAVVARLERRVAAGGPDGQRAVRRHGTFGGRAPGDSFRQAGI